MAPLAINKSQVPPWLPPISITQRNNLSSRLHVSRCKQCNLVFGQTAAIRSAARKVTGVPGWLPIEFYE